MPVTGIDQVRGRFKLLMEQAQGEKTERAITEMLILGGQYSSELTPYQEGNLLRTQGRKVWPTTEGMSGAVYYGFKYAGYIHDLPGTLKGLPRGHFGKTRAGVEFGGGNLKGRYWDAMDGTNTAEPGFLVKGMVQMTAEAPAILKKIYSVDE
jgi:hypothetical protein